MIKRVIIFAAVLAALSSPGIAANAAILYDVPNQSATIGEWGKIAPDDVFAAQEFDVGATAADLVLEVGITKFGSPTDNVFIEIQVDVAGEPSGVALLTSDTFDGATLGTVCTSGTPFFTTFTFPASPALDADTYWFVMKREGTLSNSNYYFACVDSTPAFPALNFDQFNGSVWSSNLFNVLGLLTATEVTDNEITIPVDLDDITATPFDISGTCDFATQDQLEIVVTEEDSFFNIIDTKFVNCDNDDTWSAGTMGAAAWNADFVLTLYDIVEGTFGTRVLPELDEITIAIVVGGNTNQPPPVIDPGATDDDFGFLGDMLSRVMIFLFVPSPAALERFENLFSLIASKPPIGFITVAVAAFADLEEGAPVETLEGTAALSVYFDPIRATISAFLYLLLGFWLINRLSRISI